MIKYQCPCCGFKTLEEEPPGTHNICCICGWEDDWVQFDEPDYRDGANECSLNECRKQFLEEFNTGIREGVSLRPGVSKENLENELDELYEREYPDYTRENKLYDLLLIRDSNVKAAIHYYLLTKKLKIDWIQEDEEIKRRRAKLPTIRKRQKEMHAYCNHLDKFIEFFEV